MKETAMLGLLITFTVAGIAFLCIALDMVLSVIDSDNYDKYDGLMKVARVAFGLAVIVGIISATLFAFA